MSKEKIKTTQGEIPHRFTIYNPDLLQAKHPLMILFPGFSDNSSLYLEEYQKVDCQHKLERQAIITFAYQGNRFDKKDLIAQIRKIIPENSPLTLQANSFGALAIQALIATYPNLNFKNIILESPLLCLHHLALYNLAKAAKKLPHITKIFIRLTGINAIYRQNPQRVLDAINNIPQNIPLVWRNTTIYYWAPINDRLINHSSQIEELKKQGAIVRFHPLNYNSLIKGGHEIPQEDIPRLRQEQLNII